MLLAPASIPSSFEPSLAKFLPSTKPETVILPATSRPELVIFTRSTFAVEKANWLSAGLYIAAAVEGVEIEPEKSI